VKNTDQNQGFALIVIIISIAIIAVLLAYYYKPSDNVQNIKQTQKTATDQLQQSQNQELQNNIEIQNQMNSIGN